MALIRWDEEEQKQDDLFGATPLKTVASVQSGWQPAPSGADAPATQDETPTEVGIFDQPTAQTQAQGSDNYLLSDQKAQVDAEKRQRDAEIAEARRQAAAREAAIAAAEASKEFQRGRATTREGQPLNIEAAKADTGWKKYYDEAFKKEKGELDFWGRLMDGGQASKRAETMARNKYNSELIRRAYDDDGNTIDPVAANQAKLLTAYNSALAQDNSSRAAALSRAIGAVPETADPSFWGRMRNTVNSMKQMSIYDAIAGADDSQKTNLNDVGRFAGSLLQGIGTMPSIGVKELYETASGRGTNYETGYEEDLTGAQRIGRGISGGLNVVTPFVGGSGKLLDSVTTKAMTKGLSTVEGKIAGQLVTKVATGAATKTEQKVFTQLLSKAAAHATTQAEKSALQKLTAQVLLPAVEQGAIGGAQAGAEYFGHGNTLLDDEGNLDAEKVREFAKQSGESAALGFAGGALMSGAAVGVNRLRNGRRNIPTLDADELFDLETRTTNAGEASLTKNRLAEAEGASIRALERGEFTPVPEGQAREGGVAEGRIPEGVVDLDGVTPVREGNVTLESPTPRTPRAVSGADLLNTPDVTPVADGVARTPNTDVTPIADGNPVARPDAVTPVTDIPTVADVAPVKQPAPQVADGVPTTDASVPVARGEQIRDLQESRAGKNQAQEAAINQQLFEAENAVPRTDSVPDDMSTGAEIVDPTPMNRKEFAKRFMTPNEATPNAEKSLVAKALGLDKDVDSSLSDILRDGGVGDKTTSRITKIYERMEEIAENQVKIQKSHQKRFVDGVPVDEAPSRVRNAETREMAKLHSQLESEVKALQRKGNLGERATQAFENISNGRLANMLASVGLIERNLAQEVGANIISGVKNPIKMARSTTQYGNPLKSAWKSSVDGWKTPPKTVSEAYRYLIGNVYKTAMTPVEAAAKTRAGAFRTEMTQWAHKQLLDKDLSLKEAENLSRTASNMTESVVNMFQGVENGMVRNRDAMKALEAWKQFMKTGEKGDFTRLKNAIERQETIANKLLKGFEFGENSRAGRALNSAVNTVFPFMRTAYNLTETGIQRTLNPFSKSLIDSIRADQRGRGANTLNILKNKLVDYGILGGAAALMSDNLIGYNDGDEVDKPRGIWIKIGDNKYVPVRSTPVEFPLAVAVLTGKLAQDSATGDMRDFSYYKGILADSLPYVSQIDQYSDVLGSLTSDEGSDTYGVKRLGVNTAKSVVPFSNNSVMPYVERNKGNSVNAKKVYDEDLGTWFTNSLKNSYNIDRGSLADSRDNAGRVRTVDNQGTFINKTINDASTAEFNERISSLVDYGRRSGLGRNTQDMFNTYDTGKNNNFKSVQDSITFLDAVDGKPDSTKKLEKNAKLSNLSKQIRDGFFGENGSELLTLDGNNLYSDVSVPSKYGGKNTRLPISMEAIRNAIAQTDLPEDQRNALYEIGQQKNGLYERRKAGEITYEQEQAMRSEIAKQEQQLLQNSASYQKLNSLMYELDNSGFFDEGGLGSTRSGQTYLWNALNALLGSKGTTPAANYPESSKGFTPWGFNKGKPASNKPGDRGNTGIRWTPAGRRQMASVAAGKYTPVSLKVKLGNAVKRDKSQNYSDRNF